jgi:hypothetical protein
VGKHLKILAEHTSKIILKPNPYSNDSWFGGTLHYCTSPTISHHSIHPLTLKHLNSILQLPLLPPVYLPSPPGYNLSLSCPSSLHPSLGDFSPACAPETSAVLGIAVLNLEPFPGATCTRWHSPLKVLHERHCIVTSLITTWEPLDQCECRISRYTEPPQCS